MGLYMGKGLFGWKNTSICNLLNMLVFFKYACLSFFRFFIISNTDGRIMSHPEIIYLFKIVIETQEKDMKCVQS